MKQTHRLITTILLLSFFVITSANGQALKKSGTMKLNDLEYLEYEGVNVMLAHDFYPESHQGGVGIIQNGLRVATNGDLRLEPTPGQWQPTPKVGKRVIDRGKQEISVRMEYPNEDINRKGFNPIIYPDLKFSYAIRVQPAGKGFKIIVDLDKPLPHEWIGKVGFNFELFHRYYLANRITWTSSRAFFRASQMAPIIKTVMGNCKLCPWQKVKN